MATADAPITARRSIGRLFRRDPRQHAELRIFLHVPGTAPQSAWCRPSTRIRAQRVESLARSSINPGEEYIYVLQGPGRGSTPSSTSRSCCRRARSIYIDSTMGHAYVAPKGHDEALVLGVCSKRGRRASWSR